MKFLALFAAGAMATVMKRDIAAINADISTLASDVTALDSAVKSFKSVSDAAGLLSAVAKTNSDLDKATDDAKSTGTLSVSDAAGLVTPVQSLAAQVSTAIDDVIAQKSAFDAVSLGGEVENQLTSLQSHTKSFSDALVAIIPDSLQSTAQGLAGPINDSIQKGVDAFKGDTGTVSSSGSDSGSGGASTSAAGSSAAASSAAASTSVAVPTTTGGSSTGPGVSNGTTGGSGGSSPTGPSGPINTGAASNVVVGLGSVAVVALIAGVVGL